FSYDRLPKESDRVFIKERASTGAFSATPLIYGFTGRADKILSKEKSAKKTSAKFFEWTFAAPEKGEDNKARVTLIHSKDKEKWVAHHTVYRGYPFEASARLSGVASATGSLVIIGEAAASAWFEHLGFTQNDTFARQRWGVTSRYFKALQPFKSNNRTIDTFTALNFDLKYNLLRGVWNRDELFGLIASVQSLSLDTTSANLAGFGFYWARTMPRIFNQAIELLPYFDYSKYVDLELVYYPLSLTNTIQAGGSFNLNFHGKVFWTKRVYGEAGFGLKKFEYADKTNNNVVSFASTYGTVGLGVIF
ncbi:MAG: hypothetical protein V4692_06855, partial [Bdellovibrionota bacterium]